MPFTSGFALLTALIVEEILSTERMVVLRVCITFYCPLSVLTFRSVWLTWEKMWIIIFTCTVSGNSYAFEYFYPLLLANESFNISKSKSIVLFYIQSCLLYINSYMLWNHQSAVNYGVCTGLCSLGITSVKILNW